MAGKFGKVSYELFFPGYEQSINPIHIVSQHNADFIYILSTTAKLITFLFTNIIGVLKSVLKTV